MGKISIFNGGYSDFLKNNKENKTLISNISKKIQKKNEVKKSKNKLSFKFKYELENLPKEIENLQSQINNINDELKNSNLYLDDVDRFSAITEQVLKLREFLVIKENRWIELLEMEEKIK
jgi:ATP-binding cassette subfamily F protein uup